MTCSKDAKLNAVKSVAVMVRFAGFPKVNFSPSDTFGDNVRSFIDDEWGGDVFGFMVAFRIAVRELQPDPDKMLPYFKWATDTLTEYQRIR